jgi:predicted porin
MKKSLIALAVLAASGAAMAQSSVTLCGIIDTNVATSTALAAPMTASMVWAPAATLPAVWASAVWKTWVVA